MLDEREVPILWVMQVREPTVDEAANEIEREGRTLVRAQHQLRIVRAIGFGEG